MLPKKGYTTAVLANAYWASFHNIGWNTAGRLWDLKQKNNKVPTNALGR